MGIKSAGKGGDGPTKDGRAGENIVKQLSRHLHTN
jgi:hypothetical protein